VKRLLGGRGWSAVVTVVAVGALSLGSWFVVSAATLQAAAHTNIDAVTRDTDAASHSSASQTPSTSMPIAVPPTTSPVVLSPISPTSYPAQSTTPAPVASQAPRVVSTPTLTTQTSQSSLAKPGSTEAAQVAAELIGAINQQAARNGTIPVTVNNVSLLARWIDNEGGLWANNPLNTSLDSATYAHQFTTSGQDTGIPIFPNLSVGVVATAATLLANPSYTRIVRSLRSGSASCATFARAVIRSPWASGHYGHDPAGFCSGKIVPVRRGHDHRHTGRRVVLPRGRTR
jgi:hypothetical protein